ncbi:hypothetical protein AYL99_04440 [Fonsecaea erecta]|uniref:BZIP domain-containing protein n=1 Tax=Fonsecaea erecta TaxID=1367422 RepID=A0A178ZR26_9EURO|nr:hypothetical protein AYL99_04440 [Fonsecaea erecta]OAP62237.1 hypothetical protein AYL99_04440 [Fonsecaea erecta]
MTLICPPLLNQGTELSDDPRESYGEWAAQMLVILGGAICCPACWPSRVFAQVNDKAFNLATLGVTISPFQQYPRSPPNSGYFQHSWSYQSRPTSPTSTPGPQDRWRREGGGEPQEGHPWSRQGDQPHEEAHNKYMSPSPPPTEHPSITTPTTVGGRIPQSHPSGGSAESSRPSTASVVRIEPYGGYGGIAPGRIVTEVGLGISSRRHSAESSVQTPSRAFGVHSILNPPFEPEDTTSPDVRPRAAHPAMDLSHSLIPAPAESPRSRKRTEPRSPPREFEQGSGRLGRRVLTPKSPGLRAASLGARRNPAFQSTIRPLQPPPGTGSRLYTAEPGHYQTAEIPPLPPLALATGAHLGGMIPPEPGQPRSAHVQESPVPRGVEPAITSQAERSSTGQPPYSKIDYPSPRFRYGIPKPPPAQPPAPFRAISAGGGGLYIHETPGHHGPHEGYQQGPASYQMTLDTDQGPLNIPVELDLQQASKVADEKRKRNAGASARFRARRKEKEKEASQTIAGLQQELRDLIEERDHYLSERNYFRDLALRYVSGAQLLPRPESPQQRRMAAASAGGPHAPSGLLETPTVSDDSSRERTDPGPSTQRRRTGDYQPSFTGRQTHSPPPLGYGTGLSLQPPPPLPPPPIPSMFATSRTFPPGPPPPPPVTRSQSHDPFRRDLFDRGWNSGR